MIHNSTHSSSSSSSDTDYYYHYDTVDDVLLALIGSSRFTDHLNFYPFLIVGFLGLVLNTFSFIVFTTSDRHEFTAPLYTYLRFYTVQNALMCLVNTFNFVCNSYRLFPFANTYWAQIFAQFIFIPVNNLCYFYSGVLDIAILLDRISIFDQRVKKLMKLSPTTVCLISLAACFVVDFPYFLVYVPDSHRIHLANSTTTTFTVWFIRATSFATSETSMALMFVIYALRDVLVAFALVTLNAISIQMLKSHLKKRVNKGGESGSRAERKATLMVVLMCVMTITGRLLLLVAIIYSHFYLNLVLSYLNVACNFTLTLIGLIDFFLFYFFNKNFKRVCDRHLSFCSH
jgi:hypothetical protein